jgi:uncharacterized protein YegP (UPF0339 family)
VSAHYEVVRSDAKQPWHARLVAPNGRILMSSETYAHKIDAERTIISTARAHDVGVRGLRWNNVEGTEKVMVTEGGNVLGWAPHVTYVDQRVS